jgi:predicted DNA-binding protein
MKLVTISVTISDKLNKRLEAEARRTRLPKSAIIRQALDQFLKEIGASRRQSAFESVRDLCGIIKDGAKDTSTNPKYFAGFGR